MRKILDWIVLCTASFFMVAAVAAMPLSQEQVQNYIASFSEVQEFSEQNSMPQKAIDRHWPLSSSIELLAKDSSHYQNMTILVKKYNFDSAEQWANVGDRVMRAYFIAKEGATLDFIKKNYDEAVVRINSNPSYTEKHKQGVLLGMEKGYLRNVQKVKDVQPDLKVVSGLMDEIAALYN